MNKILFLLLCFSVGACSYLTDASVENKLVTSENDAGNSSNVRAYIDPVTKEFVAPPEKSNKIDSNQVTSPVVFHTEVAGKNGSTILTPNFKPTNYLVVKKDCSNDLSISHSVHINAVAEDCDNSNSKETKP